MISDWFWFWLCDLITTLLLRGPHWIVPGAKGIPKQVVGEKKKRSFESLDLEQATEVSVNISEVWPDCLTFVEGAMALRMVVLGHSRQHHHSGLCHSVDHSSVSLQARDCAVLYGISV